MPTAATLRVRDVMTSPAVTLTARQSLPLAETLMKCGKLRHLPVVDDHGALVGIVTHRDLLAAKISRLSHASEAARSEAEFMVAVSKIMQTDVWTVGPDTLALAALRVLRDHRFGCLPVVEAGRVIGIATESDFLRVLLAALDVPPPPRLHRAGDAMTPAPRTLRASSTLAEAIATFDRRPFHHLPVVDADSAPVGLLTETEVRLARALLRNDAKAQEVPVTFVMNDHPFIVDRAAELEPALREMAAAHHTAALVSERGALVGIVTSTDACRLLADQLRAASSAHDDTPRRDRPLE